MGVCLESIQTQVGRYEINIGHSIRVAARHRLDHGGQRLYGDHENGVEKAMDRRIVDSKPIQTSATKRKHCPVDWLDEPFQNIIATESIKLKQPANLTQWLSLNCMRIQ
uniref:Uncharacterized protein n=1 Tax=Romanomermis culicivorax TaxID=13658 RepID=A0A915JNM1_ROMCU